MKKRPQGEKMEPKPDQAAPPPAEGTVSMPPAKEKSGTEIIPAFSGRDPQVERTVSMSGSPPAGAQPDRTVTAPPPVPILEDGAGEGGGTIEMPGPGTGTVSGLPDALREFTPATIPTATTLLEKPLPPGGLRFGKYHLESELGRGGMGVVYKARDTSLNRLVALKLMLSQEVPDEEKARFMREAESSAGLKHPCIVAVHDIDVHDGKLYFAMDYVEGKTFKNVIQERQGDLPLLLRIFIRICDALGYAHHKGIIHRDLKPQNVMVDGEMNPHIMDFGLARKIGEKEAPRPDAKQRARLTQMGAIMGTPVYMPPEQAGGRVDDVDTRSDIYSLGVILYSILTGDLPFRAKSTPELLLMIEAERPPAPRTKNPRCPWELERIVLKAIEKKREDRYQTAFDLKADIENWLEGRPVAAAGGGAVYRGRKFVGRNRVAVALVLVAVAAASTGGAYLVREAQAERRNRERRSAELVLSGRKAIGEAQGVEARYEGGKGTLEPKDARAILAEAHRLYLKALEDISTARQLDPKSLPASEAAREVDIGRQAVKNAEDNEIERQARADAARETRERARKLASEAAERLGAVDPRAANDLAAVEAAKAEVDGARASFLQALALDPESKVAQDGLESVLRKLGDLGEREKRFAQVARLTELGREADAALKGAEAAGDDGEAALRELRRAIAALSEALRIDAADARLRSKRVEAALALGNLALKTKQIQLAEYVIDEVRGMDPARADAFLATVKRARDDEGRFKKAFEAAEVALAAERFKDAAAAYQDALLAAAGRPEAEFGLRFARGGAAAQEGRHEEALALYTEAGPFVERALDRGAFERAVGRERNAIASAAIAAADAAMKTSRFDEAAKQVARALEFVPQSAEALRLRDEVEARRRVPAGTVLVAAGAFTFGDVVDVREAVQVPAFFIGQTEVTNKEYLDFVKDGGYGKQEFWDAEGWVARAEFTGARDRKPGPLGWVNSKPPEAKDDLPVAGVSWYEARAFARWKGAGWRLPADIEWEKAAAWDAGAGRRVEPPWLAKGAGGKAVSNWFTVWRPYFNAAEPKPAGASFGKERGVPLFDRSPVEALDMWGNVREFVVSKAKDGTESCAVRGGSFASRVEERSTVFRSHRPDPLYRALDVGFRLAKSTAQ